MEMMEEESERRFVLVHTEKMRVGSLHACMHPMYISIADCLVLAKVVALKKKGPSARVKFGMRGSGERCLVHDA